MKLHRLSGLLLVAAAVTLLPVAASAQSYSASLSGDAVVPGPGAAGATGIATMAVDGTTVMYSLLFSGVDSPTSAHIHEGAAGETGGVVLDLDPTFTGGAASGSVTADQGTLDAIMADPAGYYVQVHSAGFPNGAIRGQLTGMGGGPVDEGVVLYHPVIAKLTGQAGTNFVTDVRILNRSGDTATVTIDFYAVGGGHTAPTATVTLTVADGEQLVADDVIGNVFGAGNTRGGVIITSDRAISAAAKIFNDQRAAGEGTFAQFQPGLPLSHGWASGAVYFLSNEAATSGEGFRANLGWFNPNDAGIDVTFTAYDTDGTMIGSFDGAAGAYEHAQVNVADLFPSLADYGDHYITYSTAGGEHLFVYGSVVDNVNGDAAYIPAVP